MFKIEVISETENNPCAVIETYAICQDESETEWLIIRQSVNPITGYSPLVGHTKTLSDAFLELGIIVE
jgi:hypothetical protein